MDDDLKLVERLTTMTDVDTDTIAEAVSTITRLHGCRTAYQDTIDGLVKEREGWQASINEYKALAGKLEDRAETAEAQRDAALEALDTFGMLDNEETAYLPDEHVIRFTYDDSAIDPDLGGPNTLLGERFMRVFRRARAASRAIGGGE